MDSFKAWLEGTDTPAERDVWEDPNYRIRLAAGEYWLIRKGAPESLAIVGRSKSLRALMGKAEELSKSDLTQKTMPDPRRTASVIRQANNILQNHIDPFLRTLNQISQDQTRHREIRILIYTIGQQIRKELATFRSQVSPGSSPRQNAAVGEP